VKEKGVYEKILKSELPNKRECFKNKWVFKIKRNGIFRALLIACGYSQIPQQSKYYSGEGMLLYLIKYSRPDLANLVRGLIKCMDSANFAAYKEILRVVKFVFDKE
jgi:hypothetical protein